MTLITFQDGKAVMRDGKVGTDSGCCCNQGCPSGCPSLAGCSLIVVLDYGDVQVEVINSPAIDYYDALLCKLFFEIADIPVESGGDISANATIEYDSSCNPIVANLSVLHSNDCGDPGVSCPTLLVSLVCNP